MEESFTRDVVAAEERETMLRNRVRELELKTEESASSVISSTNAYQVTVRYFFFKPLYSFCKVGRRLLEVTFFGFIFIRIFARLRTSFCVIKI